ncbi:MAG: prepilin peptidase [Oligoflexia bacterium]|nr:prepilin peptidase [Oligoflexia bacterium]
MYWLDIIIFFAGACWGSFLALVAYRLPKKISVVVPASFCGECNTKIRWYHNLPLFSYFMLKGKCSYCSTKIPFRYWLTEFAVALLFVLAFELLFVDIYTLIRTFLLISVMIPCILIDIEHRIIPDRFSIGLVIAGFILSLIDPMMAWHESAAGIVVGGGMLFVVAELYYRLTGREGLGGGDIKLLAGVGALLGWYPVLIVIFASSILGSVYGIIMMLVYRQGRQTAIPFGPFIGIASILYFFIAEGGFPG